MLPQINQYTNLLKINFYQIYAKYHTGMFIVYTTYNILRVQYFAEIFCNRWMWIWFSALLNIPIYLYMFDTWHCILFGISLHLWLHSAINTKQNIKPNLILSRSSFQCYPICNKSRCTACYMYIQYCSRKIVASC